MWNLRPVLCLSLLLVSPAAWGGIDRVDLFAPVPRSLAAFGVAVDLSADGNRALVGGFIGEACRNSPQPECGSTYVYVRQEGGWSLEATLKPGRSVALSPDGTVALVGVSRGVYVFVRTGTTWTLEKEILDPQVLDLDEFGLAMALSEDGSTALIADPFESCVGGFCGQTYVYSRNGGAWTLETQLRPNDNSKGESGYSIGLSYDGNTALLGAPIASCPGGASCGLAHVFSRSGGTWSQTATLMASDRSLGDNFGVSVSLSAAGDVALIGAPDNIGSPFSPNGSVYVFTESGGTWTERKRFDGLAPGDFLGFGVAISGDGQTLLFASNPGLCATRPDCGVIFRSTGGGASWSAPQAIFSFPPNYPGILADPNTRSEEQPLALSEDGRTALVGAPQTPCSAGSTCGAAHVFSLAALPFDVPALGGPGLLALLLLLAGSGLLLLKRRPQPR